MIHQYNTSNGIIAFSTNRSGGVSIGLYASFNANHYCGDDPEHVEQNRQLLCNALDIKAQNLIVPHQTHSTNTCLIDKEFLSLSDDEQRNMLEGVDAVSTNLTDVCVCVSTADCIPVLLYDDSHGVVSAVHAGWRGTVARIVEANINLLVSVYGVNPSDLHAIIGPGISLHAFEVGDEVYEAFAEASFDMNAIAKRFPLLNDNTRNLPNGQKWHIDLPMCNRLQLLNMGLKDDNIFLSGICTYSNPEEFFSARRLTIKSGRILNGIMRTI